MSSSSRPLPRGTHNTNPWTPHDGTSSPTNRPPDRPSRPALPSALRNHEANVTEQHSAIVPPDTYPSATREVNFYEQPDHVPTERPPDSSNLQVHRAEAILRASTDDTPVYTNCTFRLLSEPSRFAASSTTTSNGEEGKVRQEGTRSVTHKLLNRFRSNMNPIRQTNMAVIIPTDATMDNEEKCLNSPAMIDGGSNCSIAGKDTRLISYARPERAVNISGIGGSSMNNMRIGSFATVTHTEDGE